MLAVLSTLVLQKKRRKDLLNHSREQIDSSKSKSKHEKNSNGLQRPFANQTVLGQKINVRFFLAANAALILFGLALGLVPCATTLQAGNREGLFRGLIAIVSVAGFSVLGLLYSIRKGDMSWVDSFQSLENRSSENRHGGMEAIKEATVDSGVRSTVSSRTNDKDQEKKG